MNREEARESVESGVAAELSVMRRILDRLDAIEKRLEKLENKATMRDILSKTQEAESEKEWTEEYTLTGISEAEDDQNVETFSEYQTRAYDCALGASKSTTYMALGLANEAGEVLGKLKKALRDDGCGSLETIPSTCRDQVVAELGDVLWYLSGLAVQVGSSLEEVARLNIVKLEDRKARGVLQGDGDNR